MLRKGIDISVYQPNVDYSKLKEQGIDFAIIRLGYGRYSFQKDQKFEEHYKGLKNAGIKVGCYLYSYADNIEDGIEEAKNTLEIIKGKEFELPVFIDLEDKVTKILGKDVITKIALDFCKTIENAGYKAGVYANKDWFENYINAKRIEEKYYIWLAYWGENHQAQFRVDFWQYSSKGQILGIKGNVDLNYQLYQDTDSIKKTNEEIAQEIIDDINNVKWGTKSTNPTRKERLESAGYNYEEIQKIVNEKLSSVNKVYYTVKKGDNLTKVAYMYGTSVLEIVKLNNISNPNFIRIGQVLRIK